jgi:hypothetical protein
MNEFDPSLNFDYHAKYDNQSNAVSNLLGGTVATAVDFGASVWNSLPGTEEVETADLLRGINSNALRVYEENTDTIQTASFLAGMFVPAGLAFKGLQAARAGSKGLNWFSKAGRDADLLRIEELFRQGPTATKLYRQARNEFFLKGLANQALDAVAMEGAIVLATNAHPLMEDYMADFGKNFAISAAFGGAIGGALGHVADRFAVKGLTGAVESSAFETVMKELKTSYSNTQNATQLQVQQANIQSLKKIAEADEFTYDGLTKATANKFLLEYTKDQSSVLDNMLASDVKAVASKDVNMNARLLETFANDPRMAGVDQVSFLTQKLDEPASVIGKLKSSLSDTFSFVPKVNKAGVESIEEVAYFPEFGLFGAPKDAKHYTRARDLGITSSHLGGGKTFGQVPNTSSYEELLSKNSASIDRDYLAALKAVSSLKPKDLEKVSIAADDLPTINAIVSKAAAEPDLFGNVQIKVGDKALSIQELDQRLVDLKGSLIKSMVKQGIPLETIAIRTNTPLDTAKAFVTRGGDSLADIGRYKEYDDAAKIDEYLAPTQRALKLSSEIRKKSFSELKAGLDAKTSSDINHEIVYTFLEQSDSEIAKQVGDYLIKQRKPMLDILRSGISNVVNSKAGNRFLNSTDHYVRDMGEVGTIASTIGKDVAHMINESIGKVLTPIKDRMAALVTDQVALIEANTAINLNSSIKGWRIYKDRQFWQKEIVTDIDGKQVEKLIPIEFQGQEYRIVSDKVDLMLTEMQDKGRELYSLKNSINKILGKKDMNDIGFWVPSIDPRNKFISYVWDIKNGTTRMLWGNTAQELAEAERTFAKTVPANELGKSIKIVTKSDQEAENIASGYNILNSKNDGVTMDVANVEMQKSGAASTANVKANVDVFTELTGGYEHYLGGHIRQLADISMHDVTDMLERMSSVNQHYFRDQPLGTIAKFTQQPEDAASVLRDTLLGNTNLKEYAGWKSINSGFETVLSVAANAAGKVWSTAVKPLKKGVFGKKDRGLTAEDLEKLDYEKVAADLEAQGIVNPWAVFDDEAAKMYGLAKLTEHKDTSKRLVYASNSFAATMALRVGELAQPIVNAMSLPILTSLAIANKMPESFMGIQKGTAKVNPVQVMYEGARAANDPRFKGLEDLWQQLGYFKPLISEANETLAMVRGFDPSAITRVEKALDSNIVNLLSKPSDWTETWVRRQTMYTGAVLAKRLYPELDDMGVTIFARDFMDRAVGNYHAAQRPVAFQGTMGVALGLFQTYMLTLGQNVYRALELKNYKALGTAALMQSSIFGVQSMPGFHHISKAIGEHFSDNNVDLQTGTYRALNNTVADFVLYGLPSSIGPSFYTRGEISPRVPNVVGGGIESIAGVSMLMQTKDMASHVINAMGSDNPDLGQALGEALSMQSISRPLARGSELFTGHSVTRQGNTVAVPEDVWTPMGIAARVLSTRPMEEAKFREMTHLNSYYGSLDREAREKVTGQIKTALRNGTLNDDLLARMAEEYMRNGGKPSGWRSAVNSAIAQSNVSGQATLVTKLDPDSPLMYMMDSLD